MSEWIENFKSHRIHTALKELHSLLTEIEGSNLKDADTIESVNRLRQVYELVASALDTVDPNLVSGDRLDGITQYIEQQVGELNDYKKSENTVRLANHASMDQILNQLATIPAPRALRMWREFVRPWAPFAGHSANMRETWKLSRKSSTSN